MFLSQQTFKGMVTTLKAFPEVTRYLLRHGVQYVLSNKFCQDPLEKHFGRQRGLGRRCENPNLWSFAYNENKLRLSRSLGVAIQPQGNVRRKRGGDEVVVISTSPLKKIKRQ
ncbi:hypothetical protein BaRGS_00026812 [Batillaria attramentaria]|uniref:Uncharacterized protein n=1 Tax=Batillaria attramentaria TaxID=370345 RepID=A0ABD0K4B0_9CAEN